MSEQNTVKRQYKPLVSAPTGNPGERYLAVPVSHQELDNLVGRLMQMCDLIGDPDQRRALKDTIKQISRSWLDDLYEQSGYDKYHGKRDDVQSIEI